MISLSTTKKPAVVIQQFFLYRAGRCQQRAQTSSTVMALLNTAASYDDDTDDLKAMEGELPLFYIVRKEWRTAVSLWAGENTTGARACATMNSHMSFRENPESFNRALHEFPESICT